MNKKTNFTTVLCFIIAIALQFLILAAVPAKKIYTLQTGRLITIKTAPIDPYTFLSGYHVRLNYEISRPPGMMLNAHGLDSGPVYVVLSADPNNIFSARSVHKTRPENISEGCVVIKGKVLYSTVEYGIESYYIPEKSREEIETALRENRRTAQAQIKVDGLGNAALVRLLVNGKTYEY